MPLTDLDVLHYVVISFTSFKFRMQSFLGFALLLSQKAI